jgi:hypothetical protein
VRRGRAGEVRTQLVVRVQRGGSGLGAGRRVRSGTEEIARQSGGFKVRHGDGPARRIGGGMDWTQLRKRSGVGLDRLITVVPVDNKTLETPAVPGDGHAQSYESWRRTISCCSPSPELERFGGLALLLELVHNLRVPACNHTASHPTGPLARAPHHADVSMAFPLIAPFTPDPACATAGTTSSSPNISAAVSFAYAVLLCTSM